MTTDVIRHPHITEKSMDKMDFENKLQFVVALDATKSEVAEAVEAEFEEEVADVTTQVTTDGTKKATVRFAAEDAAEDIASRIGVF